MSRSINDKKTGSVLLESTSGALAAALSVLLFYPLDLIRTRLQADWGVQPQQRRENDGSGINEKTGSREKKLFESWSMHLRLLSSAVAETVSMTALLRVGHTFVSAFIYYYLFEGGKILINPKKESNPGLRNIQKGTQNKTANLNVKVNGSIGASGISKSRPSTSEAAGSSWLNETLSSLVAANLAAMVTVILTLPLDRHIYRSQARGQDQSRDQNNDADKSEIDNKVESERKTSYLDRLSIHYEGISASLALCLNPTIHFAVFDTLKRFILSRRALLRGHGQNEIRSSQSGPLHAEDQSLGFVEALTVGAFAKILATLSSYPLLRAKVLMMTSTLSSSSNSSETATTASEVGKTVERERETNTQELHDEKSSSGTANQLQLAPKGTSSISSGSNDFLRLLKVLYSLAVIQGFKGLYKGLLVHLFHSTVRAAVSMAMKEKLLWFLTLKLRSLQLQDNLVNR